MKKNEDAVKTEEISLRERLLSMEDIGGESLTVRGWGEIWIRELNGLERHKLFTDSIDLKTGRLIAEKLFINVIIACACDINTKSLIFKEEDRDRLGRKNGLVLDEIVTVAYRLNGIGEYAIRAAEKN